VFDGYIDRANRKRSTLSRRFGGHTAALAVHAAIVIAAARFAPQTPVAPAAVLPTAVPVHVAPLYWTRANRSQPQAPATNQVVSAPAPASQARSRAARPGPRPPRRAPIANAAISVPAEAASAAAESTAPPLTLNDGDGSARTQASVPEIGMATASATSAPTPPTTSAPAVPRATPRFLPESLSQQQRIAASAPEFPAFLAVNGALYEIHARICVASSGEVDRIELLKTAHPTLDGNVRSAVGRWRYRPLLAGAVAVPFCTLVRFEFRAT
jgi:hypothetical protein